MTTNSLSTRRPTLSVLTGLALAALALSACTVESAPGDPTPTAEATTAEATDPATTATPSEDPSSGRTGSGDAPDPDVPTVPGYGVGEFPPVPLFVLPDLGLLDASLTGFTPELTEMVGSYPGLTISPARCDEHGTVQTGAGALLLYGDGSGTYTGPDGSSVNYGDGSGSYTIGGVSVTVHGDGSGTYTGNGLSIVNHGDGSGSYLDDSSGLSVTVYGDGSGTWAQGGVTITNYGDGSGTWIADATITNYGDGSGTYAADGLVIANHGDGTGTVNGEAVDVDPIDQVPAIGTFPPMGALEPITSCGTTITLDSAVLFDIDQWEIRPEAEAVLTSLASALEDGDVPIAQVAGHTDAVRDEAWNLQLSQNRADAVAQALVDLGVTAALETIGYGEDRPVASNDDAAGRQLNRRVEIFIPAF